MLSLSINKPICSGVNGMFRRAAAVLLCMVFAVLCLLPAAAPAESGSGESGTVRVGWFDTPFNRKDSFGRRTGYSYEYQRKIAAYTGWKYQYVEGNWSELVQMLQEGRIDLMSDVSFKEERTESMLYSSLPMGSELYYVYVDPDNTEILIDDVTTLNGKKVGVTATSVQKDYFLKWAEEQGVSVDLIGLNCSEEESLDMMHRGEIDAFVTLDAYSNPEISMPLWKIGSSDFYFVVSKNRPDLLAELNAALSQIQDEDKYYSDKLAEQYLRDSGSNRYLSAAENEWLADHGTIRVGFQDNYLAFCAADPKTGELTGALKDYLEFASGALANAAPEFEAVVYPTASDAMTALKNGEIDCMFPANLTAYDGEEAGVVMSPPLMRTEMDAVVRAEDKQGFLRNAQILVGVNRGNPNYEMFLMDHYPTWTPVYYNDTPACLDAIRANKADCIIISNYRYSDIARQCERLNLTTVYTGVNMDYCFAVREGNMLLYSILTKLISQVPETTVNAALTYYSTLPRATGFIEYMLDHPLIVGLVVFCVILLAIIGVLLFRLTAQKKPAAPPQA